MSLRITEFFSGIGGLRAALQIAACVPGDVSFFPIDISRPVASHR